MYIININISRESLTTYLIAEIQSNNEKKIEYAFYVFKDDVRVAVQWYSEKGSCKFDTSNKSGIYKVKGFIKSHDTLEVVSISSDEMIYNVGPYHVERWNKEVKAIKLSNFSEEFVFENCIYQFNYNGQNIDFLIDGAERYKSQDDILVCFNAAVSPRNKRSAPFFSGLRIAKKLNMPIIAISDPSLALNFNIALSWYAGNNQANELTKFLAKALDRISILMDSKLVLFGGSGGGFAALSIIPYMKERAYAAVWNPQTSISQYDYSSVAKYLSICFNKKVSHTNVYNELEDTGIVHDLIDLYKNCELNGSQILYLQNLGDKNHITNHAIPFMSELKAKEYKNGVYHSPKGITFWLNNWGDGHIVPNTEIILSALSGISNLKNSLNAGLNLKAD